MDSPQKNSRVDSDAWFTAIEEPPVVQPQSEHFRYSVWALLVATTLVAMAIMSLRYLSIFGLVLLFVGMVIAEMVMRSKEYVGQKQVSRSMWGIVMPLLCILYDPGFLHETWLGIFWTDGAGNRDNSFDWSRVIEDTRGMFTLPLVLFQCLGLAIWLVAKNHAGRCGFFISGFFWIGVAIASTIGICLFPFSFFGLLALGLGLIGFTPFWTAYTYAGVAGEARRMELQRDGGYSKYRSFASIFAGAMFAILVPLSFSIWITGTAWADVADILSNFFRLPN